MAENAVQNDFDAAVAGLGTELFQRSNIAEIRVDLCVIRGVIAMVGVSLEYRVEINHTDAERHKVIEFFDYAFECAAEIIRIVPAVFVRQPVRRLLPVLMDDSVFERTSFDQFGVIRPPAEPVGEDLINDGTSQE